MKFRVVRQFRGKFLKDEPEGRKGSQVSGNKVTEGKYTKNEEKLCSRIIR